jgi:ornithine cyclodeaminase
MRQCAASALTPKHMALTMTGSWSAAPNVELHDLKRVLERNDILAAVRRGMIDHARGLMLSPPPGQLIFSAPPGDCHIKYGMVRGGPIFVIKVAVGFFDNPALGLPVNNGLVLAFSAETGATVAIFRDEGWLTSWRTAAAGALAAKAGAPPGVERLGIVGTGHQAELQALWGAGVLDVGAVAVWGRDAGKAERLAGRLRQSGLEVDVMTTLPALFDRCRVAISCTPSAAPIISNAMVRPGTHIVALGADSPGKVELDPQLVARADRIATDDHAQCLDHGDFGFAVRAGFLAEDADLSFGEVLAGTVQLRRRETDVTIIDLTGLPAQDVAITSLACEKLGLLSLPNT